MASPSSSWLCWWRPVSDWHSDGLHCERPKLGILGANPLAPPSLPKDDRYPCTHSERMAQLQRQICVFLQACCKHGLVT